VLVVWVLGGCKEPPGSEVYLPETQHFWINWADASGRTMEPYKNLSGTSGIKAYEIGPKSITIEFADGTAYLYTYRSAGRERIEKMKQLATQGQGLNTYINDVFRKGYAEKLR
jgi:hypothetical protein